MADEDFRLSVGLVADVDELEEQIEDGDFQADVDADGGGGGRGGGLGFLGIGGGGGILAGGAAGLAAGAVIGLLAAMLAQLEPIQELLGFLVRQVELFVIPAIAPLTPVLNELSKAVARFIQFTRDPVGFLEGPPGQGFDVQGQQIGGGRGGGLGAAALLGPLALNPVTLPFAAGAGGMMLAESSPEAKKEQQKDFLAQLLSGDLF